MKLGAVAVDYDGTIATDGVFDPLVREAIGELRLRGIAVVLVTGREFEDLQHVAGNLACFNAVVAENGAVLYLPDSGRHTLVGRPPNAAFLAELRRRAIDFVAGESVIEADAATAPAFLEIIRALEEPLILAFNRSRLMVLPQAIAKSVGLRLALTALRLSIHNTIGIGDAENDHDLLDACEVGVAVEWGSRALQDFADEVIRGTGPAAVAAYLRGIMGQVRLSAAQMGRRHLLLGHQHNGEPVNLAIRGRTVLIAGEPRSGKSWLAGLLCEQLILQEYCLCIIDPEGDYRALEALPSVIVLGGDDPPPRARELTQALRHPDVSVVIDLSKSSHQEKLDYLRELLPMLAALRRRTGLPHKIVLDEAHYYLSEPEGRRLVDAELAGYILVTYRVSGIDARVRTAPDTVVMVTRETDPQEQATLRSCCAAADTSISTTVFQDLNLSEAAILPGSTESHGGVLRFELAPRLTSHVRHRTKYIDMPVADGRAFVFTHDGKVGPRAGSLKDLVALLATLPDDDLDGHLRRHDFSRWLDGVLRDAPLAVHVRRLEDRVGIDKTRDVVDDIAQAIRARYEMSPLTGQPVSNWPVA